MLFDWDRCFGCLHFRRRQNIKVLQPLRFCNLAKALGLRCFLWTNISPFLPDKIHQICSVIQSCLLKVEMPWSAITSIQKIYQDTWKHRDWWLKFSFFRKEGCDLAHLVTSSISLTKRIFLCTISSFSSGSSWIKNFEPIDTHQPKFKGKPEVRIVIFRFFFIHAWQIIGNSRGNGISRFYGDLLSRPKPAYLPISPWKGSYPLLRWRSFMSSGFVGMRVSSGPIKEVILHELPSNLLAISVTCVVVVTMEIFYWRLNPELNGFISQRRLETRRLRQVSIWVVKIFA